MGGLTGMLAMIAKCDSIPSEITLPASKRVNIDGTRVVPSGRDGPSLGGSLLAPNAGMSEERLPLTDRMWRQLISSNT